MLVDKRITVSIIAREEGRTILFLIVFASLVFAIHWFTPVSIDLPVAIAATLGTAVAILLGFKNSSAYGRWWEARKAWGALINNSRLFTYQLITYMDESDDVNEKEHQATLSDLVKRHLGFVNILRDQLRDQATDESISKWLTDSDAAAIRTARNQASMLLSRQVKNLRVLCATDRFEMFRLFEPMSTIGEMTKCQGVSEGIKNTPLLLHYSWFTTAFVWLFLILLPFCFVDIGWKMIPLVVVISAVFVMLDRSGTFTETPFSKNFNSVPLNAICRTTEIELLEQIGETNLPEPLRPVDGVLM